MECPYDIYCGLDVGKFSHYAVAIGVDGEKLADGEFPQDEVKLSELFNRLTDQGRVLVVVDQPNTIGALPVAPSSKPWSRRRLLARSCYAQGS